MRFGRHEVGYERARKPRRTVVGLFALLGVSVSTAVSADYSQSRVSSPGTIEMTVGKPGQGVFINLTPVNPLGPGYGRLTGDGPQSVLTSDVNYRPGGPIDPNMAVAAVRPNGTVTFENSPHSPVDLVADAAIAVNGFKPDKVRILDTRDEGKPMQPGETRRLAVTGDAGDGEVLNTTVVEASAAGYITLSPCGTPTPETSTNNFFAGEVVANTAIIEIGANQYNEICVTNSHHGTAHVIIDSSGSIDKSVYQPTPTGAPMRLVDTRKGLGGDRVSPGEKVRIKYGKPGDVAILNITPVNASGLGYGVGYGSHQPTPKTSSVNFGPGTVIPNMVFAEIGPDGYVVYENSAHSETDVVIDVTGSLKGDQVDALNIRLVDTRPSEMLQPGKAERGLNFTEIPYNPLDRLDMNANMELTKTHADVLYGPTPSYSFDMYEGAAKSNGYTIVYFHGGGWEGGNNSLSTGNEQLVRQLGANFGYKVVSVAGLPIKWRGALPRPIRSSRCSNSLSQG